MKSTLLCNIPSNDRRIRSRMPRVFQTLRGNALKAGTSADTNSAWDAEDAKAQLGFGQMSGNGQAIGTRSNYGNVSRWKTQGAGSGRYCCSVNLVYLAADAIPRGNCNHLTINLGEILGYLSDNGDGFMGQMRSTIGRGKNCGAE
jgi:hypothetical protein